MILRQWTNTHPKSFPFHSIFFQGSAAFDGFCSKCWRNLQKPKSAVASAVLPPPSPEMGTTVVEKPAPLLVDSPKCWRDVQKTKSAVASAVVPAASPERCTMVVEKPAPLVVDTTSTESATTTTTPKTTAPEITTTETPVVTEAAPAPAANAPAKKKKKKKTSYKNMMASMLKEKASDKDTAKDDAIRKVTGGGAFSKIDKI